MNNPTNNRYAPIFNHTSHFFSLSDDIIAYNNYFLQCDFIPQHIQTYCTVTMEHSAHNMNSQTKHKYTWNTLYSKNIMNAQCICNLSSSVHTTSSNSTDTFTKHYKVYCAQKTPANEKYMPYCKTRAVSLHKEPSFYSWLYHVNLEPYIPILCAKNSTNREQHISYANRTYKNRCITSKLQKK